MRKISIVLFIVLLTVSPSFARDVRWKIFSAVDFFDKMTRALYSSIAPNITLGYNNGIIGINDYNAFAAGVDEFTKLCLSGRNILFNDEGNIEKFIEILSTSKNVFEFLLEKNKIINKDFDINYVYDSHDIDIAISDLRKRGTLSGSETSFERVMDDCKYIFNWSDVNVSR